MARKRLPLPTEPVLARIERLDPRGRGVALVDERSVHIPSALPGELVKFRYVRRARRSDDGQLEAVLEPDAHRVSARCEFAEICGGCRTQHIEHGHALGAQRDELITALADAEVFPESVVDSIEGPLWGYRRKARLAARLVPNKGGVLVGFREKAGNYVAQMSACEVLDQRVGTRIAALRDLLSGFSIAASVPQIEVAVGDEHAVLVFRHLEPLSAADRDTLATFGRDSGLWIALQPGGLDSVQRLDPRDPLALHYELPAFDVRLEFLPTDFIQVNAQVNRALVSRAVEWLDPRATERILDLFCGLGNFTLPIARSGAAICGLEGDVALVARAKANALANRLEQVEFEVADLFDPDRAAGVLDRAPDKVLLDPPRSGAEALCGALVRAAAQGRALPRRIVYVSCSPTTFVRDAAMLAGAGYRLLRVGAVDMFPHTGHIETMGQFER